MIEESGDFSFMVKGYHSVEQGMKNLAYTNIDDILGVALVFDLLPENLTPLSDFINKLNSICKKMPVVLCSFFKDGIDTLIDNTDIHNLNLYVYTDLESMTDMDIKRSIYGTIIKDRFNPYEEFNTKEILNPADYTSYDKYYIPILDNRIDMLKEEIINAPDEKRAMFNDPLLSILDKEKDSILYLLRSTQIRRKYSNEISNENLINSLINSIDKEEDKQLYRSLFKLIKEGRL
ncbi:hypothetical protein D3C81_948380 [compost metagenome]